MIPATGPFVRMPLAVREALADAALYRLDPAFARELGITTDPMDRVRPVPPPPPPPRRPTPPANIEVRW